MTARYFQYILVTAHGLLWFYCVFTAIQEPHDALWIMVWIPLAIADIPVTIFIQLILFITPDSLQVALETWSTWSKATFPFNYVFGFWLPAIAYGAIGTLWWYFLPVGGARAFRFLHVGRG